MLGIHGSIQGLLPLFLGAGAAVVKGIVHQLIHIQLGIGIGGGQVQLNIREMDDHILLGIGAVGGSTDGGAGLRFAHVADVDTGDGNIVEDLTVVGIDGKQVHQSTDDAHQQNSGHGAKADQNDLAVPGFGIFLLCGNVFRRFGNHRIRIRNGFILGKRNLLLRSLKRFHSIRNRLIRRNRG